MDRYTEAERRNLEMAREFYDKVLNGFNAEGLERYVAPNYVQHSPEAADGLSGLRAFIEEERARIPHKVKFDVKRMFADGDHVIAHYHVHWEGFRGVVVIDIFRVEGDKFVEHWNVLQHIPEQSKNPHTMY